MVKRGLVMIGLLSLSVAAQGDDRAKTAFTPSMFRDFGHGVTFELKSKAFEVSKHKLGWCGSGESKFVCTIDGRPFFGSAGGVPFAQLDSAVFRHGSHVVHLDVSCMFDPWTNGTNSGLSLSKTTEGYKVKGEFSDGEGGYYAEWLVIGDASLRTVLSSMSEDEPAPDEPESP
jgi:hypothetical protein